MSFVLGDGSSFFFCFEIVLRDGPDGLGWWLSSCPYFRLRRTEKTELAAKGGKAIFPIAVGVDIRRVLGLLFRQELRG